MRILLTNDDGIYAEGLFVLHQELKRIGSVSVVAPDSERSSVGHGITLAHPIWVKRMERKGKFFGYGISGTPADCVKFATAVLLKRRPDLVVSGINLGPNDGCSVFYSGTIAGAREGAILGIPSIAVSLATFINPDFSYAAKFVAKLIKTISQLKFPKNTFLNINVPNRPAGAIKGVRVTRQGTVPIHGLFRKRSDPNLRTYYWMSGKPPPPRSDLSIDTYALHRGYVTVTPIQCDLTDYTAMEELKRLTSSLATDSKL